MLKWLVILAQGLRSALKSRQDLALENIALRQQLAILKHKCPRPRLTSGDRFFWILISRMWSDWQNVIHVVQPSTVVRWHLTFLFIRLDRGHCIFSTIVGAFQPGPVQSNLTSSPALPAWSDARGAAAENPLLQDQSR